MAINSVRLVFKTILYCTLRQTRIYFFRVPPTQVYNVNKTWKKINPFSGCLSQ